MKKLIILMLLSLNVSANDSDSCKLDADLASSVMSSRQSKVDVFTAIASAKSDKQKSMILEAYKVPRYDVFSQFSRVVSALNTRSYAAESRKYDQLKASKESAINSFMMRYFAACLSAGK